MNGIVKDPSKEALGDLYVTCKERTGDHARTGLPPGTPKPRAPDAA